MPMMPSPGGQPMPPDMGQMAPQALRQRQMMLQLQEAAAQGDPSAQQQLAQMQGGPPPGGPGGMPPMGGAPPMQGAPSMSQAEFSGYGKPQNADVQARQAAQLIQLLRARGGQ